jgi:hypothetical protein
LENVRLQQPGVAKPYPVKNPALSPEYLKGVWEGEDGSGLAFENGKGSYFPPEATRKGVSGQYSVTGNTTVISPGGRVQSMTIFFAFGGEDTLVATFKDSLTAMLYKRKVEIPTIKQLPITLDGIWGAVINGQQWVLQIQENQYQTWVNNYLSESGMF